MSEAWSQIALRYAKVSDDIRQRFLHPAMREAIKEDVTLRSNCLDYGCGPGELALSLASLFEKIVLVDAAPDALIEASKKLGPRAAALSPSEFYATEEMFNAIVFSMVLTTIPTDNEVEYLLCELAVRLRKEGKLIIGTTHPCFTFTALSQISYSSSGSSYAVQIEPGLEITEYHRPLSRILDLLAKAGLRILRAREIYDTPNYYLERGEEPSRYAGILPIFLVLTCDCPTIQESK
ncbi:MAG: class I SAM-dependent methyltransferase [Phycisphaerales bacterium]|nr:class I SAM-dependent methyltransferase [Phycisphaerales bacterium]